MNLTLKLSLPILAGLLFAMGYLHFHWEPRQLDKGKAVFELHNQALLDAAESALIRDVLEGNLAALIANIEYLEKKQEGVWLNMEIFADDGSRLYPLFDRIKISNTEEHDFIHKDHPLKLANSYIGNLVVDIDWSRERERIQQDIATVRNMLLGMVMFSLLVILIIQLRIIVRPLVRLGDAARKIADGNLEITLPEATKDEVGVLTNSFAFMAQELSFKQRALDQHAIVSITDANGNITYINENFLHTTGYDKLELLGKNHRILQSGVHSPEFYDDLWQTISSGRTWNQEICNRKKNGEYYWVDTTIVPLIGKDNRPERFISIGTDITVRKNTEAELVESRRQADSASFAKSRFLANMSHEFRTPLNSIIGLTRIVTQRQDLNPEIKEDVDRIHIAGQMLLSLVNDILDLSKIEAGEINIEMVPFQLDSVLSELAALLTTQARQKGIGLIIDSLPATINGYVISDPTRLRQILLNLLNNAIKFTGSGIVSLSVEPAGSIHISDDGTRHKRLRFLVKDTGSGIPEDLLPTLFDAFRQADSSITRKHGGTGLGLAIVKQLCEEMGGEVHVESTDGVGSSFTVELPFRIATEEEIKDAGLYRKHLSILLAEDDPDHRESLVAMFKQLGWNVEAVENGRELLERYEKILEEGQQIDSLVVDWQMPELDGLAALYELKKRYGTDGMPGVLVVTGYETEQLRKSPHAEIADLILKKPITVSALINGLGLVFSKHFNDIDLVLRSSILDFSHLAWLPGVKILVVDDAQVNLDLATRLLEREGAIVYTCMNGAEALKWLQDPAHQADVVLMDIQMPVMDGNTAVQEIRRIESLKKLPVIALTAAALASERKISLEAGMDDYQTKPFDAEKIVRQIRRLVGISRSIPVPVQEKQGQKVKHDDWPVIEGIDAKGVKERINDDVELFIDLLDRFTDDNRDLLQPVALEPEQSGKDALQARIHKFAGSSGLIGASVLSDLARRIEHCLRDGESGDIPSLLDKLREGYCKLQNAITPVLQDYKQRSRNSEPIQMEDAQLNELCDALQQKKISAIKLYRTLQPALHSLMTKEAFKGLDEAMAKLNFAEAQKRLDQLKTETDTDNSA
ncbi:response regulator [Desulfogranum japonicum]|uniref:response regulator n=1 Tax=Desulfogranum japonicum TaxID=231447 RepID=UPI000417C6F2|nr:response regulator [Desulfogranum japonicum]